MKEIKDYLHLYLPYKVKTNFGELHAMCNDGFTKCKMANGEILKGETDAIKPILRPLSSMTEAEMKELYFLVFNRKFIGDNITHRDIGKNKERWVLWSGIERLFIYKDGDVGADCDLQHHTVHAPTVLLWQLSKHFDLFGLIEAGLAIDATTLKTPA